jgi:hypothetical protein
MAGRTPVSDVPDERIATTDRSFDNLSLDPLHPTEVILRLPVEASPKTDAAD